MIRDAWGLADVFGVPAMAVDAETTLARIEELTERAVAMKAAANPSG